MKQKPNASFYHNRLFIQFSNYLKKTSYAAVVLLFLICRQTGYTQSIQNATQKDTAALLTEHNYPLISLVQHNTALLSEIASYKPLQKMARRRNKAIQKALKKGDLTAALKMIQIDSAETSFITRSFIRLSHSNPALAQLIKSTWQNHLFANATTQDVYIAGMIQNTSAGLNYAIHTYLFGGKPTYSKIDAISIDINDPDVYRPLQDSLLKWTKNKSADFLYYLASKTAVEALLLNGRTEAMLYDPLTGGMNAAAQHAISQTDFSKYPYSAILVPGLGPEAPEVRLTEGGKARCRMALLEFKNAKAPFLIVSGGHVHPNKTPFCEAVEMKHYLVDSLGVDPASVIIEPYARHTTTNLRNAARMIHTLGLPFAKPVLIVTDKGQSAYINKGMEKISIRDLGYTPYKDLTILSPTLTSFLPEIQSLQVNPLDPLDP